MSADLNASIELKPIYLFGGEHEYCLPGMNGYIGQYDEIEEAMKIAEENQYDWAQVAKVSPLELRIVNVGKWDHKHKAMVWQAECGPQTKREAMLKTCASVMKGGLVLFAQIPPSKTRMRLTNTAIGLTEEIQATLTTMPADAQGVAVYMMRQLIAQMVKSVQRTGMTRKGEQQRRKWVSAATSLLKETEAMVFASDRETA